MKTPFERRLRTLDSLADPRTPREELISDMYHDLQKLAVIGKDDAYLIPAIEAMGKALTLLIGFDTPKVMDQGSLSSIINQVVTEAGGDEGNL